MGNMQFFYQNFVNTSTQVYVSTGSTSSNYLFDRDKNNYYQSSGDNSDLTTTTIRVTFVSYQDVDYVAIQNINFKSFRLYYNSDTANLFSLTSGDTGTSVWTGNSATSLFLKLESRKSITSIFIEATATVVANSEKKCGEIWALKNYHQLTHNPTSRGYDPEIDRKSYEHEMSDGGIATYFIADKFTAKIKLEYISTSAHDTLQALYEEFTPFVFAPFPTATGWDSKIFEVNWTGNFDLDGLADNYPANGYSGSIKLKETPK